MSRRCLVPIVLTLLAALVIGCGGGSSNRSTESLATTGTSGAVDTDSAGTSGSVDTTGSVDVAGPPDTTDLTTSFVTLGPLGEKSIDLSVAGDTTPLASSMVGTGDAVGALFIAFGSEYTLPTMRVLAELQTTDDARNEGLVQALALRIRLPLGSSVGLSFALDGTKNTATYRETRTTLAGDGFGVVWKATGGTVTVLSDTESLRTVRLTNVRLTSSGERPITISGTVAARVTNVTSYPL